MNQRIKLGAFLILIGFLSSCSKLLRERNDVKLPKKKDTELKAALDSLSAVEFEYFYAKIVADYKDTAQHQAVKSSVRIRRDSAVSAIITYATIPMFNALLTEDSIKFFNKRDKCFSMQDLSFIKKQFAVDFSYRNVEELFMGQPVGYKAENKYFEVNDPFSYTLCSHRKRDIKKNERKDTRELITYYTLTSDLRNLKSMQIESPEDTTSIWIYYLERKMVNGYNIPKYFEIKIQTPRQEIMVEMDYRKSRMNETEEIYFVIPESYEECE